MTIPVYHVGTRSPEHLTPFAQQQTTAVQGGVTRATACSCFPPAIPPLLVGPCRRSSDATLLVPSRSTWSAFSCTGTVAHCCSANSSAPPRHIGVEWRCRELQGCVREGGGRSPSLFPPTPPLLLPLCIITYTSIGSFFFFNQFNTLSK